MTYYTPEDAAKNLGRAWTAEFRRKVVRQALNLCNGDRLVAEDVIEETLFRISTGDRRWPTRVNTGSFVYQTMRSVRSNMLRDRSKFVPWPDAWDGPAREIHPDADFIDRKWSDIEAAIDEITRSDPSLRRFALLLAKWGLNQGGGIAAIKAELNLTDAEYAELLERLTQAVQRKRRQERRRAK